MVKLEIFNLFDCGSYAGPDYAAMRFADWIRDRIDSNPKLRVDWPASHRAFLSKNQI